MKFYFLIFFTFIFAVKIYAQDTIIKINGELIPAKIIEITSTEIKYKKNNFLDGPTYSENKSDVQSIKYANGLKENLQSAPTQARPIAKAQDSISKTPEKTTTDDYYKQPQEVKPTAKKAQPADQKQDNSSKTSGKIVTDDYYGQPEIGAASKTGQLSISKKTFKLNDDIITEKQFYNLLKQTNNKEILALVERSMKAKKHQYVSFDCIFGGIIFLRYPLSFLLIEPVFILSYYKFRAVRKTCNKKAVELYNKK